MVVSDIVELTSTYTSLFVQVPLVYTESSSVYFAIYVGAGGFIAVHALAPLAEVVPAAHIFIP